MRRALLPLAALSLLLAACSDTPTTNPVAGPTTPAYGAKVVTPYFNLGLQSNTTAPTNGMYAVVAAGAVANGSFENNGGAGSTVLDDWTTYNQGSGAVFAQTGTSSPLSHSAMPAPPDGDFAASSDQPGPGLHIWYQDITVPAARSELHFQLFLGNRSGSYITAPTLSYASGPNQQFRADIMDPGAAVDDVGAGVLANIYQTQPGDPLVSGYDDIVADLSAFKGQTVRLRFAEVDNQLYFQAATDNVWIDVLDPVTKDDCKNGGWEQYGFKNQGQCVRFIETGKDSR